MSIFLIFLDQKIPLIGAAGQPAVASGRSLRPGSGQAPVRVRATCGCVIGEESSLGPVQNSRKRRGK